MLEEPRPENIGGHFGENAAFLLVFLAIGIVIIFTRTITATDTGIAGVTCNPEKKKMISIFQVKRSVKWTQTTIFSKWKMCLYPIWLGAPCPITRLEIKEK